MKNKSRDELFSIITNRTPDALDHQQALAEFRRREAAEAEERAKLRHQEIVAHLLELKKPHWSVTPTFWIAIISALAAIGAAYFAWLSIPSSQKPPHPVAVESPQSSSQEDGTRLFLAH